MPPNVHGSDLDDAPVTRDTGNDFEAVEGRPRGVGVAAEPPVIDRAGLLGRVGGHAPLLVEIIELFRQERDRMSECLHAAVDARDATALVAAAHNVKGAVGNLSGLAAFAVADRLHFMALTSDLDGAASLIPDLDRELGRLQSALIALAEEYGP